MKDTVLLLYSKYYTLTRPGSSSHNRLMQEPIAEQDDSSILPVPAYDPVTDMAESVLPSFDWEDEKKRRYLSFRLTGFSRLQSARYTGVSVHHVKLWKQADPKFLELDDTSLLDLRKKFSRDMLLLEFTRNYRLVLDADYVILDRLATVGIDKLTRDEKKYLEKLRPSYGPQQLELLEDMFKEHGGDFDWEMLVKGKGPLPNSRYSTGVISNGSQH